MKQELLQTSLDYSVRWQHFTRITFKSRLSLSKCPDYLPGDTRLAAVMLTRQQTGEVSVEPYYKFLSDTNVKQLVYLIQSIVRQAPTA